MIRIHPRWRWNGDLFWSGVVARMCRWHGQQHPATRAACARWRAAAGIIPQVGHSFMKEDAWRLGYLRATGLLGTENRRWRRHVNGGSRLTAKLPDLVDGEVAHESH